MGVPGSTWVYQGLSWIIQITIEHCGTLKATGGMGDGMGWMDLRVVVGIEHLTVLIIFGIHNSHPILCTQGQGGWGMGMSESTLFKVQAPESKSTYYFVLCKMPRSSCRGLKKRGL